MKNLIGHWRRQHTCFTCFIAALTIITACSAFVGAVVAQTPGAVLVGVWGGAVYFWGFVIGVDESTKARRDQK